MAAADAGVEFFEKNIRPVLAEHCYACHSLEAEQAGKLKGGLQLDTRAGVRSGGESGPAVVPGKPAESLLLNALRHEDFEMPPKPKAKLADAVIADFLKWIEMGAPDSRDGQTVKTVGRHDYERIRDEHRSFRPLRRPEPPMTKDASWIRSPVDAFILEQLEAAGFTPAPPVERNIWLRRVYLDLIGLPPTPKQQAKFLADPSSKARERVVNNLLARPQYGERWGRHWLDVVRYAESDGFEGDTAKPLAWKYRDYVIDAFNRDLPFDEFVREQLAGDEIEGMNARTQIAANFLRLGPWEDNATFKDVARYNRLDDIVGTTTMAFLGLNIQCSRCHDHKFEALSQADYHRMLAVFEPLEKEKLTISFSFKNGHGDTWPSDGALWLIGSDPERADYMHRLNEFETRLEAALAPLNTLRLEFLQSNLPEKLATDKPAAKLPQNDVEMVLGLLQRSPEDWAQADPVKRVQERWDMRPDGRAKHLDATIRETAGDVTKKKIDKLIAQTREDMQHLPEPQFVYVFSEQQKLPESHLFIRGNIESKGRVVTPGIPAVFGGADMPRPEERRFPRSSGRRLWLADWITGDMQHVLARVTANRLWQYHFGRGLLEDANNIGVSGGEPSHPQLLEWLASTLVDGGWRLKPLHKQIVLSATYAQSSIQPAAENDPDAALFSRWRPRVLEAEILRDNLLAVAGNLDPRAGGHSDQGNSLRRSVYLMAGRMQRLPELEILGVPDNSASVPRRPAPVTPLQSLYLMNSPFVTQQTRSFAARARREAGSDAAAQIQLAYRLAFCRAPSEKELSESKAFIENFPEQSGSLDGLETFCLALLNANELLHMN